MKSPDELQIIESHMRQKGCRWTTQRHLIARVALQSHSHFTAEELLAMCLRKDRGVSRATVYRTLAMLEEEGFVEGLDTGDCSRKFEHTLGHAHHDHMVCTSCGRIIEFRDEKLERLQDLAAEREGFCVESHSLKLLGVCRTCRMTARQGQGQGKEKGKEKGR